MVQLPTLAQYCNRFLRVNDFRDYCPNGLQLEGKAEVQNIITGVTACQRLLDLAVELRADAVLVHHGYFWKNEDAVITGIKKKRIATLLEHDISLLAYHLPLDAHADVGNNIELGRRLNLQNILFEEQGALKGLLWQGELTTPCTADEFSRQLAAALNRKPLHLPSASQQKIQRVAWCTGGAQGYIEQAADLGVDAYISGEVSEQTFHQAHELDLHYFAAGHHATESYGVQALGRHLADQFSINTQHVDVFNPV